MVERRINTVFMGASALCFLYLTGIGLWEGLIFLQETFGRSITVSALLYLLVFLILSGVTILLWLVSRKLGTMKRRTTAAAVFIVAFLFKFLFALFVQTPQYSDFVLYHQVITLIRQGDLSFLANAYWQKWGYQIGFPFFMMPFAWLFEGDVFALVVVNLVYAAGAAIFVYLICEKVAGQRAGVFASLLFVLWPTAFGLAPLLTNQQITLFFTLFGVYLFLRGWEKGGKPGMALMACAGLLLAVGQTVRPEAMIILAAMAVAVLLGVQWSFAWLRGKLLPFAVLFLSFLLSTTILNGLIMWALPGSIGSKNTFPLYKFVIGLNADSKGLYSHADAKELFAGIDDTEERDQLAREVILSRLRQSPSTLLKLWDQKNRIMWTSDYYHFPAFAPFESDDMVTVGPVSMNAKRWNGLFALADSVYGVLVFGAAALAAFLQARRKRLNLFVLIFMAYSLIYLFIEVQWRYRYLPMTFLLIAAVYLLKDGTWPRRDRRESVPSKKGLVFSACYDI